MALAPAVTSCSNAELLDKRDALRDTRGIYEECATILYQVRADVDLRNCDL